MFRNVPQILQIAEKASIDVLNARMEQVFVFIIVPQINIVPQRHGCAECSHGTGIHVLMFIIVPQIIVVPLCHGCAECSHARTHTHTPTHTCTHARTHAHTHTHKHTYTNTHTYTQEQAEQEPMTLWNNNNLRNNNISYIRTHTHRNKRSKSSNVFNVSSYCPHIIVCHRCVCDDVTYV